MNTKLIAALVIVGVLALTVVGLTAAQIATSTPNGTANGTPSNGFLGWIGRCFGYRGAQYYGTGTQAYPSLPANILITNPYTNTTTTYQGYYSYGRCVGSGFIP